MKKVEIKILHEINFKWGAAYKGPKEVKVWVTKGWNNVYYQNQKNLDVDQRMKPINNIKTT